jgi:hypothetical protein
LTQLKSSLNEQEIGETQPFQDTNNKEQSKTGNYDFCIIQTGACVPIMMKRQN